MLAMIRLAATVIPLPQYSGGGSGWGPPPQSSPVRLGSPKSRVLGEEDKKLARFIRAMALTFLLAFAVPARAQSNDSVNLRKTIVVQVVADTKSAVVNIQATKIINRRVGPFGDDLFSEDFGRILRYQQHSLGSGFLIHPDGYVVTNNHVIDRAMDIIVELADGRTLKANLISADPVADLAILKISDKHPFPTLELGVSDDLMIGEPVIAIGNPFGYNHSVSTGIVSALHRKLNDNQGKTTMSDVIQTDAAINPGNSGGPLLNAYGQVIAINTAIRSDAQNIGFAIPIDRLRDLIPELMNPALVRNVDVPLKLTEQYKIDEPNHITCRVMTDETPPRQVSKIDGKAPQNIVDAYDLLLGVKEGQKLNVEFTDGGRETYVARAVPLPDPIALAKQKLGLSVEPLTAALADKLQLPPEARTGIYIDAVDDDSPAGRAGVQAGDILNALGRFRVSNLRDLAILLDHMPSSGSVYIRILRGGELLPGILDLGHADSE